MALPSKVKRGEPIRASDWNALLDHIRASQLLPSAGVRVTRTGMGTVLGITPATSRPVSSTHPFQLIDASDSDGPKVRVVYGALAQVVPSGMSDGDTPPYILPISETCKIFGFATIDDTGNVTSRYIDVETAAEPEVDDSTAYILLGSVVVTNGKITSIAQALTWSPDLMACREWYSPRVKYDFYWL